MLSRISTSIALCLSIVILTSNSAHSNISAEALYCDESGPIVTSRDGRSGRRYLCYTLRPAMQLRIGHANLYCDRPGAIVTTRTGQSGHQHYCYTLQPKTKLRVYQDTLHCDEAETRTGASIGQSGYRYPCYSLNLIRELPLQ